MLYWADDFRLSFFYLIKMDIFNFYRRNSVDKIDSRVLCFVEFNAFKMMRLFDKNLANFL